MARFTGSKRIISERSRRMSQLVQRAIVSGNIAVPGGIRDRELYKADDAAAERSVEYDIRPDTEKPAAEEEAKKSVKAKSTKKE